MRQLTEFIIDQPQMLIFYVLLGLIMLAVLATSFALLAVVQALLRHDARKRGEEPKPLFGQLWKKMDKKLTGAVPIEKEQDIALHNYDGIVELDNHLPPWWIAMFYLGIVFGVVYMFRYHVLETAPLSKEELKIEMAKAEAEIEEYRKTMALSIDESNVELMTEEADLIAGKEVYTANCVTCHGANAEGLVGPNLTDKYWIHGGSVQDVFKTVKYGVPEKGMRSWQDMLSPEKMAQVSSYILSLQGTEPANAKEPQGEEYVPETEEQASE